MMNDNKQYPELPTHFMLVQETFHDEVYLYTSDQMRAYVDEDRAMRAARDAADAARYRLLRRGQHWSVINGIVDVLRGEALDAATDTVIAKQEQSK